MSAQRRAGLIQLKIDGEILDAKGDFSYNLGAPKRDPVIGSDGVHGYRETPQVPFIEGAITDRGNLKVSQIVKGKDLTVSLTLGNDKMITLNGAWFAGEGTGSTAEGEIAVRWEGLSAEEVS
jgi:hypothetical protein